jgi:hypothetical protein
MFKANVERCVFVPEATSYLEIYSYSVSDQLGNANRRSALTDIRTRR